MRLFHHAAFQVQVQTRSTLDYLPVYLGILWGFQAICFWFEIYIWGVVPEVGIKGRDK